MNIVKLPDFKVPFNDFIQQVENDGFKILPVSNSHIAAYSSLPYYEIKTTLNCCKQDCTKANPNFGKYSPNPDEPEP